MLPLRPESRALSELKTNRVPIQSPHSGRTDLNQWLSLNLKLVAQVQLLAQSDTLARPALLTNYVQTGSFSSGVSLRSHRAGLCSSP
jgi:hypothetical protein